MLFLLAACQSDPALRSTRIGPANYQLVADRCHVMDRAQLEQDLQALAERACPGRAAARCRQRSAACPDRSPVHCRIRTPTARWAFSFPLPERAWRNLAGL
ncbi:hypothetical protein [Stenotrophomonas sp. 2694]|uniref:hypothetical protein n=1 Tax=Stenotrophomonas sp. 2694 TaxID=3156317 RepID=UPI00339AFD8F